MVSAPILVITKSMSIVPSGCSGPLGIRSSSRTGKPAEWPGVIEPGNGPCPLVGGEGCFDASIASSSCANPTSSTAGLSSTTKATSDFNRSKVSSQQSGMLTESSEKSHPSVRKAYPCGSWTQPPTRLWFNASGMNVRVHCLPVQLFGVRPLVDVLLCAYGLKAINANPRMVALCKFSLRVCLSYLSACP